MFISVFYSTKKGGIMAKTRLTSNSNAIQKALAKMRSTQKEKLTLYELSKRSGIKVALMSKILNNEDVPIINATAQKLVSFFGNDAVKILNEYIPMKKNAVVKSYVNVNSDEGYIVIAQRDYQTLSISLAKDFEMLSVCNVAKAIIEGDETDAPIYIARSTDDYVVIVQIEDGGKALVAHCHDASTAENVKKFLGEVMAMLATDDSDED